LVRARKVVVVTRQSGKYDIYKSDIDGKNREALLLGTGHENSNISLAVSPDGQRVAFVSTRANEAATTAVFLLSSLGVDQHR
jgi:Tol biopolymer transport system component